MDEPVVVTPPHIGRPLRLHPFRGLTLSPRWIGSPATRRAFARPYRDVARRIARWEAGGRVTGDVAPAIYLHEYAVDGVVVRGLVGSLDLSHRAEDASDRAVLPHEGVHPHQVEDLAARMLEMDMNPAPILLVHRGPATVRELCERLREEPPARGFLDAAGHEHRLWALRDPAQQAELALALAASVAVIADGHHRYAGYLRLQERAPGTPWDRGLAMLVDQDDTPLLLNAIHRVLSRVRLADVAALGAVVSGARWRETGERDALAALGERHQDRQSLAVTDGTGWAVLELPVATHAALVEVLHEVALPALRRQPAKVHYEHSIDDAVARVRRHAGVAMLLPAPGYDLVHDVVAHDHLLPEKATSFQPKPPLGVLMRSLRDE